MRPLRTLRLEFDPGLDSLGDGKRLSDGLSVVARVGSTLWVANDESASLERLSLIADGRGRLQRAAMHQRFPLADLLRLPHPPAPGERATAEVDIEGLAHADGYLWLVGSHSLKRKRPRPEKGAKQVRDNLATLGGAGNRYLLARLPVGEANGLPILLPAVDQGGRRCTTARLRGGTTGNDLTDALGEDVHLAPFLAIPGKDNGFDIEGLALAGERVFLGLRGPVLRGWAVILEIEPVEHDPSTLGLKVIGPGRRSYRKHFVDLGGLGVRDLCAHGSDLLILAGPTMALDGPVRVFRWPGGMDPKGEVVVTADQLQVVFDVPHGAGVDHAEGMTLLPTDSASESLLVVYDSASPRRRQRSATVVADLYGLAAGAQPARG